MSGYYQMQRGWRDHDVFGNAEYSERDAWGWLIEAAAWKPTTTRIKGTKVDLERGQMSFSQRFMAEKWGWSKSRVDRFLKRLADENMILTCSKIGATAGHPAGQGQSIISICNYDKYQIATKGQRGNDDTQIGATAGQQRGKEEEGKKERKKRDTNVSLGDLTVETAAFEAFWTVYRRKDGKAAALKAWRAAIKRGKSETFLKARAERWWSRFEGEQRFAPHASTWLNGGRYDDPQSLPGSANDDGPLSLKATAPPV